MSENNNGGGYGKSAGKNRRAESLKRRSYAGRRDFTATPEPLPSQRRTSDSASEKVFVIQKHSASRLHWDLRLERNGVLESWAVPKEPPAEAGVKRLAVKVEDHPLDYANFEGVIPPGNYGAGKVEIWDRGVYSAEKYERGEILLRLDGRKLKGNYALINTGGKNWLFFRRSRNDNERT